ncbi:MAG: Rrf2 family transcriptional regulator [Planctomycetota bacterium]
MKLTKTSAQAALAMGYLADQPEGRPTQARQVAEYLGIPTDSALKILQTLVRQQVLRSQLGRSGGYHMLMPAEHISLLQIIEAIDGPIAAELPIDSSDETLAQPLSTLREACVRSADHLRVELSRITVADLTAEGRPSVTVIPVNPFAVAG